MSTRLLFEDEFDWWNTEEKIKEYEEIALKSSGWILRQEGLHPPLFEEIGNVKGLKVLDYGCANGWLIEELAKMDALAFGCDISEYYIQKAKKNAEKDDSLEIDYKLVGKDGKLPYPDKMFKIVVSNLVLDCIKHYREMIDEMHRVLEDDGKAIVTIMHPDYFIKELIDDWLDEEVIPIPLRDGRVKVLNYHKRKIKIYEKAFKDAGFQIDKTIECRVEPGLDKRHPDFYFKSEDKEKYSRDPYFLIIDLIKTS